MVLLPTSNAMTFFYGASDVDNNSATELSSLVDTVSGDNLPEVTDRELKSVFSFCTMLPRLEESGKMKANNESKAICKKLIDMLQPMFKKKSESETKNDSEGNSNLRHRRKRKSRMTFV
ncbi:hypothetical protein FO519_001979 [Halicephalobus sp. NKZ332]|nr:hypothetical protein FO519_001979 [Halicephalobus sp. NKZ332]